MRAAAAVVFWVLVGMTLVSPVSSFGQQRSQVVIGDLALTYDAAQWNVRVADRRLTADCVGRGCGNISLTGGPTLDPPSSCNETILVGQARGRSRPATIQLPGLVLHLATIDLGCRNLVPHRVAACIAHAGRVYRFDSGPHGCRGGPSLGTTGAAIDLLKGLAAR